MLANKKDVLMTTNDDGKQKVVTEDYAFLMESTSIQYIMERQCNVTQIGGLLDEKGYGIAMKKCEFYENNIHNLTILIIVHQSDIFPLKLKIIANSLRFRKTKYYEIMSFAKIFSIITYRLTLSPRIEHRRIETIRKRHNHGVKNEVVDTETCGRQLSGKINLIVQIANYVDVIYLLCVAF